MSRDQARPTDLRQPIGRQNRRSHSGWLPFERCKFSKTAGGLVTVFR